MSDEQRSLEVPELRIFYRQSNWRMDWSAGNALLNEAFKVVRASRQRPQDSDTTANECATALAGLAYIAQGLAETLSRVPEPALPDLTDPREPTQYWLDAWRVPLHDIAVALSIVAAALASKTPLGDLDNPALLRQYSDDMLVAFLGVLPEVHPVAPDEVRLAGDSESG